MRAAGAEVGQARGHIGGVVGAARLLDLGDLGREALGAAALLLQHAPDHLGDAHRLDGVAGGEQLLAPVVAPAVDPPAASVVEDRLLELDLDQLALLLDADDQIEPLGPVADRAHPQRPDLPDLVERDAEPLGLGLVDAEQVHGVDEVEPVLARRDEADLRAGLAPHAPVDAVGLAEALGGDALEVDHARFLRHGRVAEADAEPALGHGEVGTGERQAVRVAVHHRRRLDVLLHGLEPDPDAGVAAQRPAVEAVVQDLLHAGRADDGHVGIDQRPVGLVQDGGGLAGVVVPHRHQHAAVLRGAGHVGVAHHVARAVHPRPLAVPEREDAVMAPFPAQLGLLAAPDGGGGEVLVQPRLEQDVGGLQDGAGLAHLKIHRAQGRAAVAGHVSGRVEPRGRIARPLHQHQAHQGLRAVQEHGRLAQIEAVAQAHVVQRHRGILPRRVARIAHI